MTRERSVLLSHLSAERKHVLAAVDGLSEQSMTGEAAPSGWSMAQLLNHLIYDVEIFWAGAILEGDEECIAMIQDGWTAPVASGAEVWRSTAADVAALKPCFRNVTLTAHHVGGLLTRSSPSLRSPTPAVAF